MLAGQLIGQVKTALALEQGGDGAGPSGSLHQIAFPVAKALARLDDGRALADRDPARNEAAAGAVTPLFAPLLVMAAQMRVELAARRAAA